MERRRLNKIRKAKADAVASAKFKAEKLNTLHKTSHRMGYILAIAHYQRNKSTKKEKLKQIEVSGIGPMLARAKSGEPIVTPEELKKNGEEKAYHYRCGSKSFTCDR